MVTRRRGVLLCGQARTTLAAIARELTRAGMPLVIQAAAEELKAARRLQPQRGAAGTVHVVSAELGGLDASRSLVAAARKPTRGLAAVVICPADPLRLARSRDADLRDWDDGVAAGLRTPFFLAQQAALALGRDGGGRVLLAAAIAGDGPVAGVVRAGLVCMIDALAKAMPRGVSLAAVLGGGRGVSAKTEAPIAGGVRFFLEAEHAANGAFLDLGTAPSRG